MTSHVLQHSFYLRRQNVGANCGQEGQTIVKCTIKWHVVDTRMIRMYRKSLKTAKWPSYLETRISFCAKCYPLEMAIAQTAHGVNIKWIRLVADTLTFLRTRWKLLSFRTFSLKCKSATRVEFANLIASQTKRKRFDGTKPFGLC